MDKRKEAPMPDVCKHGSLRRSCEICERDEEIARLTERVRELEGARCDTCPVHPSFAGAAKREEEITRLKAELAAAREAMKADVRHPIGSDGKPNTLVTYCYSCGENVRRQKFCGGCGKRLNWKSLKEWKRAIAGAQEVHHD